MIQRILSVLVLSWTLPPGLGAGDGKLDGRDLDQLSAAIAQGRTEAVYDLNVDGVVDANDIGAWLVAGGARNVSQTSGLPFLGGDANLDGRVDGRDFAIWNDNKFTRTSRWSQGDFNADGVVDEIDFAIWRSNQFLSSCTAPVWAWTQSSKYPTVPPD